MGISDARAENRIALVIGNSNYTSVTALPNPTNDAKAMTKFLSSAGFQVLQAPDLTQSDMRRTIGNFASMVSEKGPDTVALVFYAGHGLQVDGENFLVPVDAQIEREADVPLQATRLADLMKALSTIPSKSRIVILDACRNNPFSAINKTAGRGLAIVDAPNGSLVAYHRILVLPDRSRTAAGRGEQRRAAHVRTGTVADRPYGRGLEDPLEIE